MGSRLGRYESALPKATKKPSPSYGIIASQNVKTMYASEERGIDGGKQVRGRKRHLVVDVLGNLFRLIMRFGVLN